MAVVHRLREAPPAERAKVLAAVNASLIEALQVPVDSHPVRLCEYEPECFLIPRGCSDAFTLIEVTVYPGRKPATKKRLYQVLIEALQALGISPTDVRIVLYEVERENWGLKGGTPASEIDVGFEVEI